MNPVLRRCCTFFYMFFGSFFAVGDGTKPRGLPPGNVGDTLVCCKSSEMKAIHSYPGFNHIYSLTLLN